MPSYTAPVEDMMFLFEKLRNNKKYNELEKYKEVTSDLVKDILQEAAKTGEIGDGKIFITSIDSVVRIRTGDKDEEAL